MNDVLQQANSEINRQQEDTDRAMKELLEEEKKDAADAADVWQKQ